MSISSGALRINLHKIGLDAAGSGIAVAEDAAGSGAVSTEVGMRAGHGAQLP